MWGEANFACYFAMRGSREQSETLRFAQGDRLFSRIFRAVALSFSAKIPLATPDIDQRSFTAFRMTSVGGFFPKSECAGLDALQDLRAGCSEILARA
jgi:hypothetical protein